MTYYDSRIKRFQKSMKCSYVVLVSEEDFNPNVFYFTGFNGTGILIIPKKGTPSLLASVLDVGNVENKKIKSIPVSKSFQDAIKKVVSRRKKIGFDFDFLSVTKFNFLKKILKPSKTIAASQILLEQRAIKDSYEISQIKRACKESSDILSKCIKQISNFNHEHEIKTFLDSEAKRRGHDLAYDTIVASGKNTSNPHYSSCRDKLRRGFLVIDFGVKVNGYSADITRTLFLGTPTKEERTIYKKVLDVQKKCIELLNGKINKSDEYARNQLGPDFIHSLGHGIGLQIHELPSVNKKNKNTLQNGNCFTVEPGIYIKNKYGIRIEDDLIKSNNKINIITPIIKELIVFNKKIYK